VVPAPHMRPIVIGIGGAHSSAGKTTYASLLLQRLRGWGAIKYTKTSIYASITDDRDILSTENKDTRRMLDSGAERVIWVQSPPSELGEVLPLAVERLSDLKGIVVEGNSAIEFLRPDIILFIFGTERESIKESAKGILNKAHIVISEKGDCRKGSGEARWFRKSPADHESLLAYVTGMIDAIEKIRSLIREQATDGKIPCTVVRKIAEELNLPYHEAGKAANELGIKITNCELGCF
jgi:molybdopterin-guanine dinucleotide biosynthesis protein